MSRSFITLNGNHLSVPCCCDGEGIGNTYSGNVLQCEVGKGSSQTVINFTTPPSETQITPVGEAGIGSGSGDLPETIGGDSLDLFTTSCSMGDPAKRHLAVDADGTQLQSDDGLCAGVTVETGTIGSGLHSVLSDSPSGGYLPCSSRIDDHCETFAFNPPTGYIPNPSGSSEICQFDEIQSHTNQAVQLGIIQGENRQGCSYKYIKDWDDDHWETPGEIYEGVGPPPTTNVGQQPMYNSNNIPIKRMECCIGHPITGEGTVDMTTFVDFNECPVDTTKSQESSPGETIEDKIRAYVTDSLMCDGRSSQEGNIDQEKTPQHWCTYNMQDNFDIANYDDYYSMLTDDHCKEWLKQDSERASVNPNNPRANAYSSKLSEFYKWISDNLSNDYELKPYKYHEYVPLDTTVGLTMSNRSDFDPPETGSNFDVTNDSGKFISLLKIESPNGGTDDPPLVKMFLNHAIIFIFLQC